MNVFPDFWHAFFPLFCYCGKKVLDFDAFDSNYGYDPRVFHQLDILRTHTFRKRPFVQDLRVVLQASHQSGRWHDTNIFEANLAIGDDGKPSSNPSFCPNFPADLLAKIF